VYTYTNPLYHRTADSTTSAGAYPGRGYLPSPAPWGSQALLGASQGLSCMLITRKIEGFYDVRPVLLGSSAVAHPYPIRPRRKLTRGFTNVLPRCDQVKGFV
jgi:hypothetical protein